MAELRERAIKAGMAVPDEKAPTMKVASNRAKVTTKLFKKNVAYSGKEMEAKSYLTLIQSSKEEAIKLERTSPRPGRENASQS